ncbi:unnamed protein product, partial [Nippostrongylus brasiliensis]|uniref:Eukaryotic translation initiation factor 3 subunit A n=1 Tax=Nippostrongylus brasiliensis TaxID=27835 RepID=A0A0N4XNM3_NIPBR
MIRDVSIGIERTGKEIGHTNRGMAIEKSQSDLKVSVSENVTLVTTPPLALRRNNNSGKECRYQVAIFFINFIVQLGYNNRDRDYRQNDRDWNRGDQIADIDQLTWQQREMERNDGYRDRQGRRDYNYRQRQYNKFDDDREEP